MTQRHQDLLRSISARPAHLDTGAGPQEVVSIVGRDVVFEHGLCAEPILGTLRPDATGSQRITPERFQENAAFVQYLRGLLAVHVYDLEGLQRAAQEQGDGYVYLIDARPSRRAWRSPCPG